MYLSDQDYEFIYSKVPRICADLCFRKDTTNGPLVLLTKRTIEPYINHWHFPGGRIKFRESVRDALNRIANDELGVDISNLPCRMTGFCEFPEEYQKGQARHSISLVHEIYVPESFDVKSAQDKYEWFSEVPEPIIPPQKLHLLKQIFFV